MPKQRTPQPFARSVVQGFDDQDQTPTVIPRWRAGGVDMAGGFLKAATACGREVVIGASPLHLGGQPLVLRQTIHAGANQPLIQAQRSQKFNQTAQPNAPATRQHRIAKHRHNQRAGAQTALLTKSGDAFLGQRVMEGHEQSNTEIRAQEGGFNTPLLDRSISDIDKYTKTIVKKVSCLRNYYSTYSHFIF
jgi:hypothetical protein